jgi:hypothetical protein
MKRLYAHPKMKTSKIDICAKIRTFTSTLIQTVEDEYKSSKIQAIPSPHLPALT